MSGESIGYARTICNSSGALEGRWKLPKVKHLETVGTKDEVWEPRRQPANSEKFSLTRSLSPTLRTEAFHLANRRGRWAGRERLASLPLQLHLDDAVADGVQHQLAGGMQIEFVHQVGAMSFDGFYAD